MKTKILFSYTENIVPKGCRKPRPVLFSDGELEFEVREVASAEAPVAIRAHHEDYVIEWRWFDGVLWTALAVDSSAKRSAHTSHGSDWDYATIESNYDLRDGTWLNNPRLIMNEKHSKDAVLNALMVRLENILIIDGVTYCTAGEPCYKVCTFGLGNNHGGTALMTDFLTSVFTSSDREYVFGLLDREEAIRKASEVAEERGDTKDLPIRPHGPRFEVLTPEAISERLPPEVKPCGVKLAGGTGAWF